MHSSATAPATRTSPPWGHKVVRVTWRQIVREPYAVVARIAQALVA